jgi:putative salt-induced outer membrane protein YdiY
VERRTEMSRALKILTVAVLVSTAFHGVARAQDAEEEEKPWSNVADLSLVAAGGNAEVLSWALSDKFTYGWTDQQIELRVSALQTRTTVRNLTNVSGSVAVEKLTETTAEEYFAAGRFRQRIVKSLYAYTIGSWYRNELAGIRNRTGVSLGVGYQFFETDRHFLTGELGGDWTNEEQLQLTNSWFGAQAIFDYVFTVTETTTFDWDLAVLPNLEDTDDLRVNTVLGLTTAISSVFALKVSYTVLFDNQPVKFLVDGTTPDEDALFEFEKVDHRLAASLVMNL